MTVFENYLENLFLSNKKIKAFLKSGKQIEGMIKSFDKDSIILESCLVRVNEIETLVPCDKANNKDKEIEKKRVKK